MTYKASDAERVTLENFEREYVNAKDEYSKFLVLKKMSSHIQVLYENAYYDRVKINYLSSLKGYNDR